MYLTIPTTAGILALTATFAHATTFHNKDTAYSVNVAKKDGSTSFVGPSSSIEIDDGWAYIRACQPQRAGDWFVCRPGELTWPEWYGDVYWYMGGLTDASGTEVADSGDCTWGTAFFDPNDCPAGYQSLPAA
ncbi:unnamed protein product [Penicillium manginii]